MRIGIFGGSFDPIHFGHLILAERCREHAALDEVRFVPCAMSPDKRDGAHASDRQRKEMTELAIAGNEHFRLSTIEMDRGGVSYTVDTLQAIRQEQPEAELFLLIGDDSLGRFASWRQPETICSLATPLIVNRPGSGSVDLSVLQPFFDESQLRNMEQLEVESPKIDISSSEIRQRLAASKTVRYLLPRSVEKYIETQKLYRPAVAGASPSR